jgi:hypothetical protein
MYAKNISNSKLKILVHFPQVFGELKKYRMYYLGKVLFFGFDGNSIDKYLIVAGIFIA